LATPPFIKIYLGYISNQHNSPGFCRESYTAVFENINKNQILQEQVNHTICINKKIHRSGFLSGKRDSSKGMPSAEPATSNFQ